MPPAKHSAAGRPARRVAPRGYRSPACSLHEWPATGPRPPPDVQLKRIYAPAGPEDGRRVLVDRLWPRGISRTRASLAEWLPELAPSAPLRRWFGHDPARWQEFRRRYRAELAPRGALLEFLREEGRHGRLTLVYAARDPACNHARVLQEVLVGRLRRSPP